jgi:hypothetical protein
MMTTTAPLLRYPRASSTTGLSTGDGITATVATPSTGIGYSTLAVRTRSNGETSRASNDDQQNEAMDIL